MAHIEVQSQHDTEFAERMYVYNYRIFDRYRRQVSSIAVLGDESAAWRPVSFGYTLWDCQVDFRFPVVKLVDYRNQWAQLEASANPFATVVMAHLKTQETARDDRSRQQWKFALTRRLYGMGYSRDDVVRLYHFIDWLMQLPEALEAEYWQAVQAYEGEQQMTYVTYAERVGVEKGIQLGRVEGRVEGEREGLLAAIELGLDLKFGAAGLRLYPELAQVTDVATLHAIVAALKQPVTLEELWRIAK